MEKASLSNKVFTENSLLDELVYNIRQIITGVVVKDEDRANENETLESATSGDLFVAIQEGRVSFNSFKYDGLIIHQAIPYATDEQILQYTIDNSLIPTGSRPALLKLAVERFMGGYIETNNYYRMLHGDPIYDETGIYEGLWIDPTLIDMSGPVNIEFVSKYYKPGYSLIHELPVSQQNILYMNGTLDNIISNEDKLVEWEFNRSDVEYLLHLGDRSVSYYNARTAPKFALLYCPSSDAEQVQRRFKELFEANRLYTLYTVYSEAYKYRSDYYDNFMMIFITLQTAIDIIIELPEYIIRRDIFDARTCQYIFESNGVKYYRDIPLKYQVALVKNLNKLIKFKSTDKCIVDIVSLFGVENVQIFKYYILKDRLTDPISLAYSDNTKEIVDSMGNITVSEDNDTNYDLKFIKVPLSGNYDDYIRTDSNIESYDEISSPDNYWIGDKDYNVIKSDIKNLDFTVLRSKYYSIEAVIDLTKRNFTLVYFMNILMYNDTLKNLLLINLPNVSTTKQFELVDVILTLYSLGYIYYGVDDTIMDSRMKIAQILGFNPEVDMAKIASWLEENHKGLTPEDLHIEDFVVPEDDPLNPGKKRIPSFNELQNIFFKNRDIYDHVTYMLTYPPTKDIYDAYKYIYKSLFIMDLNMEYFLVGNNPVVDEYKLLGYKSKFITIPKESDYTNPEDFIRDYNLLLESLDDASLCFAMRDTFDEDHLFDLYIKGETDLALVGQARMAYTYREFLEYKDPALFTFIEKIAQIVNIDARQEACVNAIQSIVSYLKDYIDQNGNERIDLDDVFSGLPSISVDFIKKYVSEVINFFKSFKIFTHESSVLYVIGDKFENYIKLIDKILLKYLFDKSDLVRIEDHLEGKAELIEGLLLNRGNGIGIDIEYNNRVEMIDKIWFSIDTWVQRFYKDYYDSDKYQEYTKVIRDYCDHSTTHTLDDEVIVIDSIIQILVDLTFTDEEKIIDTAHLEETRDFNEFYNEWVADTILLYITIELPDKMRYQDDMLSINHISIDTVEKLLDGNGSFDIGIHFKEISEIVDNYYKIITQEFPEHQFDE